MKEPLRLLCVFAHPDDETLGVGGALARYAAEGVEIRLVMATRGERGWPGPPEDNPGLEALGQIREAEVLEAARVLGVHSVAFLGYVDGELDQADPMEAIEKIAAAVREARPHVVITFDPFGSYGHPDHIAINQFTNAAIVRAADPQFVDPAGLTPHAVPKLYYFADTREVMQIYQKAFGELRMMVDGQERRPPSWPHWALTAEVDTAAYRDVVWRAVECHRSQQLSNQHLKEIPPHQREVLWSQQRFYRAYSLVNGGRLVEKDLFEGLREGEPLHAAGPLRGEVPPLDQPPE